MPADKKPLEISIHFYAKGRLGIYPKTHKSFSDWHGVKFPGCAFAYVSRYNLARQKRTEVKVLLEEAYLSPQLRVVFKPIYMFWHKLTNQKDCQMITTERKLTTTL